MSDRETKARADIRLMQGDCLQQMRSLPDNSVDSIVTDPPYGISFMAKKWDYDVPSVEVWAYACGCTGVVGCSTMGVLQIHVTKGERDADRCTY